MKYPFIKMNIMQYIASNGYMTGYSFIQYCKSRGIPVSNGTIYPHLKELEASGIIECEVDGKRKVYRLTPFGDEWIKNSTNASMPTVLKHLMLRVNRDFDLIVWEDAESIRDFIPDLLDMKDELIRYANKLEAEKEDKHNGEGN